MPTLSIEYQTEAERLLLEQAVAFVTQMRQVAARITLANPASGRTLAIWLGERYRYVQVFSGDTLAETRRRQGLAIEPMTCPPGAFRS